MEGELHAEGGIRSNGEMWATGTLKAGLNSSGGFSAVVYDPIGDTFYYNSSSARYKDNIVDFSTDFSSILKARPVLYTRKDQPYKLEVGYIAEEMKALGLDYLVGYNEKGQVDYFNYEKMVIYAVEVLKIQKKEITELEKENERLNERLNNLEKKVDLLINEINK